VQTLVRKGSTVNEIIEVSRDHDLVVLSAIGNARMVHALMDNVV
jgi:hypothetical protein